MPRTCRNKGWTGLWLSLGLVLAGPAFARHQAGSPPGAPVLQTNCERQGALVEQLEATARTLAVADECGDASQCRAAPVGAQACGGPRDYLVYCATSTDEEALLRVLSLLAQREERYNSQCGVVSICVFVPEPQVVLVGDTCQATPTSQVP